MPTSKLESQRTSRPFADLILRVREANTNEKLTITSLLRIVGPKGQSFLGLFFCVPFAQPIPLPGLSTPFGAVLIVLGFMQIRDRPPTVPARWGRLTLDQTIVFRICSALDRIVRKLEPVIRPRKAHLFAKPGLRILCGCLIVLNGFLLSLPLPIPFSNNLPASTILLLSLGTLEEDFGCVVAGFVMAAVTLLFFSILVIAPYLAIRAIA